MKYNINYIFLSPAKINLFLKVLNKRDDGYHNIISGIQKISLFDEIKIRILNDNLNSIKIFFSDINIDSLNNTVYQAITNFKNYFNFNDSIIVNIKKNIPKEAGLGGGSSNAATVLKFLNKFYNSPLDENLILNIAKNVGADVPLFLSKKNSLIIKGIGEIIEDFSWDFNKYMILIAKPDLSISTKWAYKNLNLELTKDFKSINRAPTKISEFFNDLESVIFNNFKELINIKNFFYKHGANLSLMTGSGSAIFALFNSRFKLFECVKQFNLNCQLFIVKPLI